MTHIHRNLIAMLHRHRCDRATLIPVVEAMTEAEAMALFRLLNEVRQTGLADGKRPLNRGRWPC